MRRCSLCGGRRKDGFYYAAHRLICRGNQHGGGPSIKAYFSLSKNDKKRKIRKILTKEEVQQEFTIFNDFIYNKNKFMVFQSSLVRNRKSNTKNIPLQPRPLMEYMKMLFSESVDSRELLKENTVNNKKSFIFAKFQAKLSAVFVKEDKEGKETFGKPQYANSEIMTVSPLTLEDVVKKQN